MNMNDKLKLKYRRGKAYTSNKAPTGNGGHTKKNQIVGASIKENLVGQMVMLMNLSGERQFCAGTGAPLPFRGMAVSHNGKLYKDRAAIV